MTTNLNRIDWVLCLAWSLGHAILTALVSRTAVNADETYSAIKLTGSRHPEADRWIGRCKACGKGHRIDGMLARGIRNRGEDQVVVSGTCVYMTGFNGTDPTTLSIQCCSSRVKLGRVYDSHKPNRPRHECNAKCLASTGPACECMCGGKNHGRAH